MSNQIAFVDRNRCTFAIIGYRESLSGQFGQYPMPDPGCPVIDITQSPRTNIDEICKEHISPDGVDDIPALIEAVKAAGAVVGDYQALVVVAGLNNIAAIPVSFPIPSPRSEEEIIREIIP